MSRRSLFCLREITIPHRVVVSRVCRRSCGLLVLLLVSCLGNAKTTWAQHPPGTMINNTAHATFNAGTRTAITANSNAVDLTVVPTRSSSTIEFLHYQTNVRSSIAVPLAGTQYSVSGEDSGPFLALPNPVILTGTPIDLTHPVPLSPATTFFQGDPVFIQVTDADQNRNAQVIDTILLSLENTDLQDRELLKLSETGPNTGAFVGFIQTTTSAAQAKNGTLSVRQNQIVTALYLDQYDPADNASTEALFDPVARVFDSRSGEAITGVTIRLVDHLTGAPAAVTGNDGVSVFPATITTGQTLTDAAGTSYDFGPGGYRFPHLAIGEYRLELDLPPGYRAPSRLEDQTLQTLTGAPFSLHPTGSRGGAFFATGQPLLIDLPVDRVDANLFITKTAGKTSVAVGDFLSYEIKVENATDNDASELVIVDNMPAGFRYQGGSTLIDGQPADDPELTADGRTMIFRRTELVRGSGLTIRYVLGVVPGAVVGDAVNRATARWAQTISNEATALVTVRRDLFGDTASIIGRISGWDCETDTIPTEIGVAGVRVYLDSGAFAVTDEQGRYHLAGVEPGAHLVQMDLESLPAQYVPGNCHGDSLAGEHPWSHLVDLQGGTMWRSDFQLRRMPAVTGEVKLAMDTGLQGDTISGLITVSTPVVPLKNMRLTVVLPEGSSYTPATSRQNERVLPDPEISDGTLTYRLGDLPQGQPLHIAFEAQVNPPLRRTTLEVKSLLVFETPAARSNRTQVVKTTINLVPEVVRRQQPEMVLRPRFASLRAELSPTDIAQIDTLLAGLHGLSIVAVKVIGHSDSQRIRPGAHPVFTDNHALSLARAEAVGRHISQRLALSEAQLAMYGMGDREPVADNRTAQGRALNRRVTLQVWTEKITYLLPEQIMRDHERVSLAVTGFRPGETWPTDPTADNTLATMPSFDEKWLATAGSGERILWPPHGYLPHLPTLKLAVQHAGTDSVHLFLNNEPASRRNFLGRSIGPAGAQAVSTWTGLDLITGDNIIVAEITDNRGLLVRRLERRVHYSGPPVFAELVPERSVLVADGKTPPVIAVRLTDDMGYPARREVVGKFTVTAPHQAWREKSDAQRESLTELQEKTPTYTIGPDGIALLRLAPTTTSGEALLELGLRDHGEELRVWLQPQTRDWILAGVVEGSVGYQTVAGNLENLAAGDGHEDFYSEGRLAFFAKGQLKGKWLLTLAYDSQNPAQKSQAGLFGLVDPDAYYTVYGDGVTQQHDAPTSDHLYIRLERQQFYALYGDFNTSLTKTEMARYSRAMTGLRSSRRGETLSFDFFASENRQNYRRDEIPGDGTSGLYQLSVGRIIPHSEKITLQVRDRYRSEIILSERHLTRSVDYALDELDGSFFCKESIPSQDENFNPVWLIVEYETETAATAEVTAGGRGSWRPGGGAIELGITGIREGTQGGRGDILAGVDTQWDINRALRLKTEYASSHTRSNDHSEAWFGELSNRAGPVTGRMYFREQQPGFGLGQQGARETGTRKFGTDLRWQQFANWQADGTIFSQTNLITGAERHFGELKFTLNERKFTTSLGVRLANDQPADGSLQQSRQITADASLKFLRNKGRVRISHEQGLSGQDESADFPTRTGLGLEYEVVRNQKIILAQEIVAGSSNAAHRTRLGVESVPWQGARITSSAEQRSRENERRVFANAGLKQTLRLNDHWHLDGSLDHGQNVSGIVDTVATVETDFTAGSLGASYRAGRWLVDQRLEYRTSDTAEKWGLASGLHMEPGRHLGLLASLRLARTNYRLTGHHYLTDASVGLAWRPDHSPWTVLDRLSYRTEDKTGDLTALSNWRIVNNLNVLRMFGSRDQLSLQLGVRYNRDTIDGRQYCGFTDQTGLEWRHFIGSRWDVGLRGAARHGWQAGVLDYSGGLSAGYKVLEDIWLSLGYNFTGYHDRDFSAADYTAQGPYLRFRVRLNQETTHEMLR